MVRLEVANKRLLKLADFLSTLPRKRFDFASWVGEDWEGKEDLSCGTTACALGWAATMPAFKKLGLRLRELDGKGFVMLKDSEPWEYQYGNELSHEAANFVFRTAEVFVPDTLIDVDSEKWMKTPGYGATPKQMAAFLRRFVAARRKAVKP